MQTTASSFRSSPWLEFGLQLQGEEVVLRIIRRAAGGSGHRHLVERAQLEHVVEVVDERKPQRADSVAAARPAAAGRIEGSRRAIEVVVANPGRPVEAYVLKEQDVEAQRRNPELLNAIPEI